MSGGRTSIRDRLDPTTLFCLDRLASPIYAERDGEAVVRLGFEAAPGSDLLGSAPALLPRQLGAASFLAAHGLRFPYVAGAMAGGIGSEDVVVAMAQGGMLGFFGAGGLDLDRIEDAIGTVQGRLSAGESYGFNLLHNPADPGREMAQAELYVRRRVPRVSASGYMRLTAPLVVYRAQGLNQRGDGRIEPSHHVFAKISRTEVAREMMEPAPAPLLDRLVGEGRISRRQAELAAQVPVAEDITVEGDSGGHTDRQSTIVLLSGIRQLRDRIVAERGYTDPIRVGAAGGIATPDTVAATFAGGADYVLAGSIHQSCREAGTSQRVKEMLTEADFGKIDMAPAGDMFEMGVQVQVLKHRTLFAPRAQKLLELYRTCDGLDDIGARDREQLERRYFRRSIDEVWSEVEEYLAGRGPGHLEAARRDPKKKMAFIFRWYLHMSSLWAQEGTEGREVDYQIWCGPAMAAFNHWVRGTFLESAGERRVVVVARNLLQGAATLTRGRILALQGVPLPPEAFRFAPRLLEQLDAQNAAPSPAVVG